MCDLFAIHIPPIERTCERTAEGAPTRRKPKRPKGESFAELAAGSFPSVRCCSVSFCIQIFVLCLDFELTKGNFALRYLPRLFSFLLFTSLNFSLFDLPKPHGRHKNFMINGLLFDLVKFLQDDEELWLFSTLRIRGCAVVTKSFFFRSTPPFDFPDSLFQPRIFGVVEIRYVMKHDIFPARSPSQSCEIPALSAQKA